MEESHRDHARRQLQDQQPTSAAAETVTDLGLVQAIAHRKLGEDGADDALAALTLLRYVREDLAGWEPRLIAAARASGASWVQLAPALGVASRQAAERRYLRLRPDQTATATTGEQRVQAERDRRAGDRAVTRWARQNAIGLRRLAAEVSALDGDILLTGDARDHVDLVTTALGENDTAALLQPLADAGPHLQTSHPHLADRIAGVTDEQDQIRRTR